MYLTYNDNPFHMLGPFSKQNHLYRIMPRALGHSRGPVRRERPTHRISCHCARAPQEQGGKPPHKCCTFQPVSPGYPAQSNAMVYATARRRSQSIPPRSCAIGKERLMTIDPRAPPPTKHNRRDRDPTRGASTHVRPHSMREGTSERRSPDRARL